MTEIALEVRNLNIKIGDQIDVISGLSFTIRKGETLCLVGESGCGKSITALSILNLLPPIAHVSDGEILLAGRNLLEISPYEMRKVRGNEIAMIFQEPMSSLNPLRTIGFQISEVMIQHLSLSKKEAWDRSEELLRKVQIPAPRQRLNEYPHQLSGGMRQRVMIAMALACEPAVILADEPTTALDVTIQAQITDLLNNMQDEFGSSILLITHDMGIVAENADRVIVMYAGHKVEEAEVREFFRCPSHPYSRGLLASLPNLNRRDGDRGRLSEIPGSVPALGDLPPGCPFYSRCDRADERCQDKFPPNKEIADNHFVACWHPVTDEVLS